MNLPTKILVAHQLNDGYVRLNVRDKASIANIELCFVTSGQIVKKRKINSQESDALYKIWDLYSDDVKLIEQVKSRFIQEWDSFDSLRQVRTWWENMPNSFELTPIGKVLANTNAQRYYKGLPNLSD